MKKSNIKAKSLKYFLSDCAVTCPICKSLINFEPGSYWTKNKSYIANCIHDEGIYNVNIVPEEKIEECLKIGTLPVSGKITMSNVFDISTKIFTFEMLILDFNSKGRMLTKQIKFKEALDLFSYKEILALM